MKKAANYLGLTIVLLLMVAAMLTYLAPHVGWRVDAVLSGSMEPQLLTGSLVVTRPVESDAIVVGDVITFRPSTAGGNMITHRVIGIGHSSPLYFQTKGDANDYPDPFTVPAQNLIGKICFHVPYLGYITEFLKTPFGFVLGLMVPALIVIAVYVRSIWRVLNKDKKQNLSEIAGG
jgi:signal peptidase